MLRRIVWDTDNAIRLTICKTFQIKEHP